MGGKFGRSFWIPSVADLFFCTILLTLCLSSVSGLLGDGDTGYHIRAGEYILRTRSVPRFDIFSFHTPPLPWTAHEWLSEVLMALVHRLMGLDGVVVLFAAVLAGSMAYLFVILRREGADVLLAAGLTLAVYCAAQIHWLARPHAFSFLFMLFWQHRLECWQRGDRGSLYWLPVSLLFWVNLHGGFLGGFLLLGAYLAGNLFGWWTGPVETRPACRRRSRTLACLTLACLAAALVNPRGYQILFFPFKLVGNRFLMDHVSEFLSPNFHEFLPFKYLLLLTIVIFALSRRSVQAVDVLLVLTFTNMALYSARYIALFALVSAPVLARHWPGLEPVAQGRLGSFLRRRSQSLAFWDSRSYGALWSVAALAVVLVAAGTGRLRQDFDPAKEPVAATEFLLREPIAGNMFNDDEFGDYLIYRGYPRYRVFFDGRSDMYGTEKLKEYCAVAFFEPEWERILEKYRITWIFFGSNTTLARYLARDPHWVLVYSDPLASIFVRNLPHYRRLIASHRTSQLACRRQDGR